MTVIRVLLASGELNDATSLRTVLQAEPDVAIVGPPAASNGVTEPAGRLPADVVVVKAAEPAPESVDAVRALLKQEPGTLLIVVVEPATADALFLLLRAGARGLLLAHTAEDKIAEAIKAVRGGGTYISSDAANLMIPHYLQQRDVRPAADPLRCLSSREREVLSLVVDGMPSSEIARQLSISPKSVDTYRSRLMKKLGTTDIPSLVKFAIRYGLISANASQGGKATVSVSESDPGACAGNKCYVGYWIDWDGNGAFDPNPYGSGGEYYVAPVNVGVNNLTFPVPTTWTSPLAIRFRLYYEASGSQGSYLPTALAINGEVEDYLESQIPAAVTLASFGATCQATTPVISWETVSEIDTAGFNVWRSDTAAAPEVQLNATMIPAHPGSTQGYSYSFADETAQPGQTYYYWLEDIDLTGATGLNGPIELMCSGPTAVTMGDLAARGATGQVGPWWTPLIALVIGIGLAGLLARRLKPA